MPTANCRQNLLKTNRRQLTADSKLPTEKRQSETAKNDKIHAGLTFREGGLRQEPASSSWRLLIDTDSGSVAELVATQSGCVAELVDTERGWVTELVALGVTIAEAARGEEEEEETGSRRRRPGGRREADKRI